MAKRAIADAGNFLSGGGGGASSSNGVERENAEEGGGAGRQEAGSKAERSRPFSGEYRRRLLVAAYTTVSLEVLKDLTSSTSARQV